MIKFKDMTENPNGYSIIIPVYNGEKTLPDTLRSIRNLESFPYEIIVVDDGSTDGSAALAREAGAKVMTLPQNQGPAQARNQGAHIAKYETLIFTDSDVLLPKGLLQKLEERFLNEHPDAIQGTFSEVCPYANFFSQYKNLYNRYVLNQLPDWIDTTFTSITAVRRKAFLQCGGFDAHIRGASVEDRTLGRNLIRHGYRILLDRGVEVIHNKKLSFQGFLRNQFYRSRDLAKLLLRQRKDRLVPNGLGDSDCSTPGRFGTNSQSTMMRIPIAYLAILCSVIAAYLPVFWMIAFLLFLNFLWFIVPFELFLVRYRGIRFALWGMVANFLDAIVSGAGVLWGIADFVILKNRY